MIFNFPQKPYDKFEIPDLNFAQTHIYTLHVFRYSSPLYVYFILSYSRAISRRRRDCNQETASDSLACVFIESAASRDFLSDHEWN